MKVVNICMSGGRTSAYMTEKILKYWFSGTFFKNMSFVITFANTGREHEKTLEFVNNCDKRWRELYGVGVVWLESVVEKGYKPCTHKIVNFETASRKGEPFEEVVKKYGIPNKEFLHCTRELKENPIISFMELLGHKKGHIKNKRPVSATYETWIGIREDEPKRLKGRRDGKQFKVYPLAEPFDDIDFSCDKQDVLSFWEDMPFNLDLPEHLGNCIDCHKKSFKKLFMCIRDLGEESFYFTGYLDVKYSEVKAQVVNGEVMPRKRFRDYKNTSELISMFKDSEFNTRDYSEESGGCSESCEPFMQDNEMEEED